MSTTAVPKDSFFPTINVAPEYIDSKKYDIPSRADVRVADLSMKAGDHKWIPMKLALSSKENSIWGYSVPKANNDDASDVILLDNQYK